MGPAARCAGWAKGDPQVSVDKTKRAASLLDWPELYDATFAYRDIPREVDFILAAFKKSYGYEPEGILDLACGTGSHSIEFARRGFRVCGIDRSETMLGAARAKAEEANLEVDFRCEDMSDFRVEGPFSCAICMLHSLAYLTTNDELTRHFSLVSRALAGRGLYVAELGNPQPWLADPPRMRRERWQPGSWSDTRNGMRIRATAYRDPIDWLTETAQVEMVVDITGRGVSRHLSEISTQRLLLPQTLRLLAELGGGLRLMDYFGDFSLDEPMSRSRRHARMIGLFAKGAAPAGRGATRKPRAARPGNGKPPSLLPELEDGNADAGSAI